jgi:hypothetical protein
MNRKSLLMAVLGMFLILGGTAFADKPVQPPCGTNGPLKSTEINPSNYSYVQTSVGSQTASFTISSPPINVTGSCDALLPNVYGNGDSGASIDILVRVIDITSGDGSTLSLTEDQQNALKNAFAFDPASFTLTNPGSGNHVVMLTFTNTGAVPPGEYIVNIQTKIANPELEKGLGIGPANKTFTFNVTAPQQVTLDTLPPIVTITSPTNGSSRLLNSPLHIEFTAVDPIEDGFGTGVWAMRAFISSCGETIKQDISGNFTITPSLSISAGAIATATEDTTASQIGTFTLKAEADDNATPDIHTGSDVKSFTVGVGVTALPPISVTSKQFNTGSDVSIKWAIADGGGAFLPSFDSITAVVKLPSGETAATYVKGDGASYIRMDLDATGNALQYIANYKIPSAVPGTYKVEIYVNDVCGTLAKQGEFTFYAVNKGK